jgi:4-amino-4-deoxy-L-arabinose transferase-like glycosyltransferase
LRFGPLGRAVFSVILFLLAFLPRAIQPVSRPLVWYLRSARFIEAVLSGDWANTVYSEHPGVTLMWPAGIGLKLYWVVSGITPAAQMVPPDFEPIRFFGPVPRAEIAAAIIPLTVIIALGVVAAYWMLRNLLDEATSAVAGLLLSTSPYYLAHSKVLHLEAMLATLMLLSALALLVYRRSQHRRWLLLSGVLGGLALLVKVPALFLLPFAGLVLLVDLACNMQAKRLDVRQVIDVLLLPLLVWCVAAVLVYVVVWPAMWVQPPRALAAVVWGLSRHAALAHDSPTLFLGQITREDPGPVFYMVSLLFRTSEVELVFLVVAAVIGIARLRLRRSTCKESRVDLLLLLCFAVLFVAQMSMGAKKITRYILPSLLVLDVLAAAGLVGWARSLAGERRRLGVVMMLLPVLIQAAVSLARHPNYGTVLNWLAGGPPAAGRAILIGEEGEGYTELARHLNTLPDVEDLTVVAQLRHVFSQTFRGTTVEMDERQGVSCDAADYLVFHRNYTARDYKIDQWGRLWERYAARTPEREVQFDGVPYAWLYPRLSPGIGPERPQLRVLGERFRSLGYDLRVTKPGPGERVPLVLYWQATSPVTDDLSIFLHLTNDAGELIWQDDGAADHGSRPTWSWGPGDTIVDPHTVVLPSHLPEGEYALVAGIYDWKTGERLPVYRPDGKRVTGDQISLATLAVRRPRARPAAWVARGLGLLTLVSVLLGRPARPRPSILVPRDEVARTGRQGGATEMGVQEREGDAESLD